LSTEERKKEGSHEGAKFEGTPKDRRISHTWLSGNLSATLVIPIEIARSKGLDRPSDVIVEETEKGILIRKLEV
jgi:hypothetical protein